MIKQVSIIGCGWLGFPLGVNLIQYGFIVNGSTTSKKKIELLKANNIKPFLINITQNGIKGDINSFLKNSDLIIINMPPGLRKNPSKDHVSEITYLAKAIEHHQIKKVIYVGSTSVFKDAYDFPKIYADTEANNTKGAQQLIEIESLLCNKYTFETTIIRFGGLFDEERHPAKYLSGRTNVLNPDAPVNLIHKNDCINIISKLIKNDIFNTTVNAVNPSHPTKSEYYTHYCKQNGLSLPKFNHSKKSKGKIIESIKLVQLLNYSFKQAL